MTAERGSGPGDPSGMCVLHVHTNTAWGGGENQVLQLVLGLARRGVRAVLATPQDGALYRRALDAGAALVSMPTAGRWWRARAAGRALAARATREGARLIHAHDSAALTVAEHAGRLARIPVVLSRRVASPLRRNPWSAWKYSPRRLQAVLAISETVRAAMMTSGYPAQRIHVVPSAVDGAALLAIPPDAALRRGCAGRRLVGGLGKLAPKKNWALLVRTAALLKTEGLDLRWVVAGDGPERAALEALCHSLGVGDVVRFIGFREDGTAVLRALDVLFFPSRMEGASVTVREAMALGIPVVAADAPAVIESLAGTGWTVAGDDAAGAARAVREALAGDESCRRRTEAARRVAAERYTVAAMVDGTLRAYRSAGGDGP